MDEMDYVMHNPESSTPQVNQVQVQQSGAGVGAGAVQGQQQTQTSAHPTPPQHHQHQHQHQHQQMQLHSQQQAQQQPQGCPYFRSDHHQNQNQNPHQNHFRQHLSNLPPPHHPSLPQQQQQQQQQQHNILHQHQIQPQSQPQIQHHPAFLSQSPNRNNPPITHPHYDPVHAASNSWYPAFQWSGPSLPSHPPLHPHTRTPSTEAYFSLNANAAGPGPGPSLSVGGPGGVAGGSGVPGLMQSQQASVQHQPQHQHQPHHDPFGPFFYRHPPHQFRVSMPPHNQNQLSHANNTNTTNQPSIPPNADRVMNSAPTAQSAVQQQQQQQSASRGISLPALNPPPPPHLLPNMPSSGESSPDAPPSRRSLFGNSSDSPRGPIRASGDPAPSTDPTQTRLSTSGFRAPEPSRSESRPTAASDPSESTRLSATPPPPPNGRRYYASRAQYSRPGQSSDYDSDEDFDPLEEDRQALRFIEHFRDMGEAQVRAHQILRGQLPNKRIASKKAISQLQSVDMSSLSEADRTCVICYNEFGVQNPEGVNEAPLRLPGCKHVFGDHCIKKWFEESDSCPYCRDKVPSEPLIASDAQYIRDIRGYYRQYPGGARGASGRAVPLGELGIRIVPHRDEDSRFSTNQRAWQTGDRRSPPSEVSESRRRTRPRHSSFRASQSTTGPHSSRQTSSHTGVPASVAPSQQSPARERVNPPNFPPYQRSFMHDSRRTLTPHFATQFASASHRPYSYHPGSSSMGRPVNMPPFQPMEPLGLNPPPPMGSAPQIPQMVGFGGMMGTDGLNQPYQGPAITPADEPQLPGPAQLDAYSQQLPTSASLPPVVSPADGHHPYGDIGNGELRFSRADPDYYSMRS